MAAEISPCGEVIAFITGINTIMTFDKEMNYIDDKPLEKEGKEDATSSDLGINDA